MKISIKKRIHNCDKHLSCKDYWDEVGVVETIQYCTVCGRIKNHDAYGADCVINYKPKEFINSPSKALKKFFKKGKK